MFYELYVRRFAGYDHSYMIDLINPHGSQVVRHRLTRHGDWAALGDGELLRKGVNRRLNTTIYLLQPNQRRLCESLG